LKANHPHVYNEKNFGILAEHRKALVGKREIGIVELSLSMP